MDPDSRPTEKREPCDLAPVKPHRAGGGVKEPRQEEEACRLSGSVWAQKPGHLSSLDGDREAVYGAATAKRADEVQPFKDRGQGEPP